MPCGILVITSALQRRAQVEVRLGMPGQLGQGPAVVVDGFLCLATNLMGNSEFVVRIRVIRFKLKRFAQMLDRRGKITLAVGNLAQDPIGPGIVRMDLNGLLEVFLNEYHESDSDYTISTRHESAHENAKINQTQYAESKVDRLFTVWAA